jgi:hypothetical protein
MKNKALILWAHIWASILSFTPRYWFWQVYELREEGPAGSFVKVGLVRFEPRTFEVAEQRELLRVHA